MDVKEAVASAKNYLSTVFAEEGISELRLEEVEYSKSERAWHITLGLIRPTIAGKLGQISAIRHESTQKRNYKVVRIPDNTEEQISIKIRNFGDE